MVERYRPKIERYRPKLRVSVYYLYNKVNGKCYVGLTKQEVAERIKQHHRPGSKSPISRALRRYGLPSFCTGVIAVTDTRLGAGAIEQFWILKLCCRSPQGYNLTAGGDGVHGLLPEVLERRNRNIGIANRKNKPTEELKARISTRVKALWADPAYRKNQLEALRRGQLEAGPRVPSSPSEATKAKQREARLRYVRENPEAHRANSEKIRAGQRTPEAKAKMRAGAIARWELEDRVAHGAKMKKIMATSENQIKRSNAAMRVWDRKRAALCE